VVLGGVGAPPRRFRSGNCSHDLRHPAVLGPDRQRIHDDDGAAFAPLTFGKLAIIPRWLGWLSVLFFVEQGIETVTVFGTSGFIAPGGAMNLHLGGAIGMAWVIGVLCWGFEAAGTSAPSAGTPEMAGT
jgi:hypothetical protein